ncbi:MAG: alpha/beta hydrolase [Roseiflexaceae bacterium]
MLRYRPWRLVFLVLLLGCTACDGSRADIPPATATLLTPTPTRVLTPIPTPMRALTPTPAPTATNPPVSTTAPTVAPSPTPTASPAACSEGHGRIVRARITSAYLGKQQDYRVYLPPCYAQQRDRRYPVVYLLHGAGRDDGHWDDVGVDEAADPLIVSGQIPPLLIVLPDGNRTYGPPTGDPPPFAGFLVQELIPHIDGAYRTRPDREHRAIGGISLGGAWALLLAARYPEIFSAVGGHSPAIGTLNGINPDVDALVTEKLRIYLDVGAQDSLKRPTAAFDAALTQAHGPHEFHVYPGGHIEAYWTSHLEEYLHFYAQTWRQ